MSKNTSVSTLVVAGAAIAPYISDSDAIMLLEKAAPYDIGEFDLLPVLKECGAENTLRALEIVEHTHFSPNQCRTSLLTIARLTKGMESARIKDLPPVTVDQLENAAKAGGLDTGTTIRDFPTQVISDLLEGFSAAGFNFAETDNPAFILDEFIDMEYSGSPTRAFRVLIDDHNDFNEKVQDFLEECHPSHRLQPESTGEDHLNLDDLHDQEHEKQGDLTEEEKFD